MTLLFTLIGYLLGMFMLIQVIAAIYGVVDYRYQLARYARQIAMNIIIWSCLTGVLYMVLPVASQAGFIDGILLFIGLNILAVCLMPLISYAGKIRRQRKSAAYLKENFHI